MPAFGFQGINGSEDSLIRLQRDLNYIIMNLDHKNVRRLYTEQCDIKSEQGETIITGPQIIMSANGSTTVRLAQGYNPASSNFEFALYNNAGAQTVGIDSSGNALFTGTVIASEIICGTSTGVYFHVSTGGTMTAYNAEFKGYISASTIIGGVIKTANLGARIEQSNNSLYTYNDSSQLNGLNWGSTGTFGAKYGDAYFYDSGIKVLEFYNNLLGNGYSIRSVGTATLEIGGIDKVTYLAGNIVHVNNIGFFGTTSVSKTSVSDLSTDATPAQTIDKLNELLNALQSYGLV
jgi:hypothetical protein